MPLVMLQLIVPSSNEKGKGGESLLLLQEKCKRMPVHVSDGRSLGRGIPSPRCKNEAAILHNET